MRIADINAQKEATGFDLRYNATM